MVKCELEARNQPIGTIFRQAKDEEPEEAQAQMRLALQRDSLASSSSNSNGETSVQAHVVALKHLHRRTPAAIAPTLLDLQRQYGNRFVQRVVNSAQPSQGDRRVAPEVEEAIQRARGGGQPLDSGVRTQMEPAFRTDFSRVRVHAGSQADTLNRALQARAFTTGQDIFFKQGEYSPGSKKGRELLAHELTHVVQQNGGHVQTKLTLGQPGDKYEQEADRVARSIMQNEQRVIPTASEQKRVHRQTDEEQKEELPVQTHSDEGVAQRQAEEDENVQTKPMHNQLQRQMNDQEEEQETVQSKSELQVQRQSEEEGEQAQARPDPNMIERRTDEEVEEDNTVQEESAHDAAQRQSDEEEQPLQAMPEPGNILRQPEEEEPLQTKAEQAPNQRQTEAAEPEPSQQPTTTDATAPKQSLSMSERGALWAFEKGLGAAGIDQKQVMGFVGRAGPALMQIIQHPGRFLTTIIKALGQGFTQFKDNIGKHLMSGLLAWLFGTMARAGIQLPKDFSPNSILGFVLQVLGLTPDQLRQRLAKVIGEKNVQRIQRAWQLISTFVQEGLGGLWNLLKEHLGNLKEMVLEEVKNWLIVDVVKAAVLKVAAMFNPVTGLIAIIKTIYNVIRFLVERGRQITALFQAVTGSVVELALGNFKAAANKIELSLARVIPIVIGFLASLLGLSGIGEKVKTILKKIQAPVEKAIDKGIEGITKGLKKLGGAAFSKMKSGVDWTKAKVKRGKEWAQGRVQQVTAWFKHKFESVFTAGGESHRVWIEFSGNEAKVMVASNQMKKLAEVITDHEKRLSNLPEDRRTPAEVALNKLKGMRDEWRKIMSQLKLDKKDAETLRQRERYLQERLERTAKLLETIMDLGSSLPQRFSPGKFEYKNVDNKGRARGGKGWLAPWEGQRGEETKVSRPITDQIEELQDKGIKIEREFHGGHLIAHQFGGSGIVENLVPMESRINTSYWGYIEGKAKKEVATGKPVFIKVTVIYDDARPLNKIIDIDQAKMLLKQLTENEKEKVKEVFARIPSSVSLLLQVHESDGKVNVLANEPMDVRKRFVLTFAEVEKKQRRLIRERMKQQEKE